MGEDNVGYMCKVDFEHELGSALGGVVVYPSLEDLKKCRNCVNPSKPNSRNCGIVKVRVELIKIIDPGNV